MKESREEREQRERAALRLMEALSGTDEELLEHAQGEDKRSKRVKGRKPIWQYGRAWAAACCLLAVGVLSWGGLRLMTMRMGNAGSDFSGGVYDGGEPSMARQENMALPEGAEGAVVEDGASPGEIPLDGAEGAGQEKKEGENSQSGSGGQEKGHSESRGQEDGGSEGGGLENGSVGSSSAGKDQMENDWVNAEHSTETEDTISEGCLAAPERQKLTEAQARESKLGAYVPEALPAGYVFEEGSCSLPGEGSQAGTDLRLTWCRGMDSISLFITQEEIGEISVVDVNAPETYDRRMYEIPLGETVPEEYWESVINPVFAAEDLSLKVIESRMVSGAGDQGDTDTPRGNFAVLYSGGVLVKFSGRGTAEEIWKMFEGLE